MSEAFEHEMERLMVATPDAADPLLDPGVTEILRLVREHLGMDVVFITQYVGDHNLFRHVHGAPEARAFEGQSQLRAESYCQRVLDGRLPAVIPDVAALRGTHDVPDSPLPFGAYMAAPVRLHDGTLYGTLCCFSFEPQKRLGEREYRRLLMSARLTAQLIDEAYGRINRPPAA